MKKRFLLAGAALVTLLGILTLTLGTGDVSYAGPSTGPAQGRVAQVSSLPEGMVGVTWELVAFQRGPRNVENTTGQGITLKFDPSVTLGGSGGCNSYGATYRVGPRQSISIREVISTLRACEEPVMRTETAYFEALESVTDYSFDGLRLQLNYGDGQGYLGYINPQGGGQPGMPRTGRDDLLAGVLPLLGMLLASLLIGAGYFIVRYASRSRGYHPR